MKAAYIIRNKKTKEQFFASSGRYVWSGTGPAKNAFNQTMYGWNIEQWGLRRIEDSNGRKRGPRFDEQDVYEIVELKTENQQLMQDAVLLLIRAAMTESLPESLSTDIRAFLRHYDEQK